MKREVMRPTLFRPPVFGLPLVRDFSGFDFVIAVNDACDWKRMPGLVGLYVFVAIVRSPYTPSMKSGALEPAVRRTYALRQSRLRPTVRPIRFSLPRTLKRRTSATFTLKSSS